MTFKPMLASKAPDDLESITYPVLVSPKLDGIRCVIHDGQVMTRSLKLVPNDHVRELLKHLPDGLDGELLLTDDTGFNATQSAVMRKAGEPDITYHVFDWVGPEPFAERYHKLVKLTAQIGAPIKLVLHSLTLNEDELKDAEDRFLSLGYEGLMVRSVDGPYKFGRATTKQGWLMKVKRFNDAEATVTGTIEQLHNNNAAERDHLGHTKRSTKADGMVPAGVLGSLCCVTADGIAFNLSGFTHQQRKDLWAERDQLVGRVVTFKYQPDPTDSGLAPRFPIFLHFRKD